MINWIFDLDYTLYQYPNKTKKFDYEQIVFDPQLKKRLKMLPGNRYMFTNANVWHTQRCVKMMKIEGTFNKIVCRELSGLKPDFQSFQKFLMHSKMNNRAHNFFFEDTIDNLVVAKEMLGWKTIYIGSHSDDLNFVRNNPHLIDYSFSNITEALLYFQHQLPRIII